jgi:hypothetical protein
MSAESTSSSATAPTASAWIDLHDPGASNHPHSKAGPREQTLARIVASLQAELRVDDPKQRFSQSEKTAPPRIHHYQGTEATSPGDLYAGTHGLFDACHNAWAQHKALVLGPDDIWLAIQGIFAGYMSKNAEALRATFVAHAGQKELAIGMDDAPNDWPLFVSRVVAQVGGTLVRMSLSLRALVSPLFTPLAGSPHERMGP